GGGQGGATMRAAPAYVGIYGGVAVASAPWTWLRGGVFLETGDREAVGLHLGPRIARGAWVFGAGASALVAPYTLYGPTAHVGLRLPVGGAALVPGAELVAFAGGSDLPAGKVVTELLLAVGVEIDAW
ncbi:MAG: hypothetical protein KC464_24815, partial [Myxococcales bacterium]|nr:hypothetical protein [Myxococcales bacterium]